MIGTDIARIVVGLTVLAFAGVCDLRWRRAPDASWLVVAAAGLGLLTIDAARTPDFFATHAPALWTSGLIVVMAIAGYLTGLITGGADAKALASLALLAPLPLTGWSIPLASPLPLAVTALTNGLIVALSVPVLLFLWNVLTGDIDGWRTFLGYQTDLESLDVRAAWPLEYVDEQGEHQVVATPGGVPRDAFDPAQLAEIGRERVWVTPKVPFLVPLWLGLVIAVLLGDPFAALLETLLV